MLEYDSNRKWYLILAKLSRLQYLRNTTKTTFDKHII